MQKRIVIGALLVFIMSCNNNNRPVDSDSKVDSTQTSDAASNQNTVKSTGNTIKDSTGADSTMKQKVFPKSTNISMVVNKMEYHVQLNDVDFNIINGYLSNNKDESSSEGVGYTLFIYLKGNKEANESYASFLNKKGGSYKEKILEKLVQVMCIDLGDEKYTSEKLISDFSLFKESTSAQKALKKCMDNHVE